MTPTSTPGEARLRTLARRLGPSGLERAELLALATGGSRPLAEARALLERCDLATLSRASVDELQAHFGLAPRPAVRLAAAFELGRRLHGPLASRTGPLNTPERLHRAVRPELVGRDRERFLVLLLDGKHRLRRLLTTSVGTLTSSLVHPREVFGPALREGAAALAVAHNHPSGDPEPSAEDLEVTRRLVRTGRLVGIPLIDHLVVGDARFVSLRERLDFATIGPG